MSVTPRVNGATFHSFIGHTVRLVGRVHSLDPSGTLQVVTSDGQLVTAFSQQLAMGEGAYDASVYTVGSIVEMVGQVQQDGSLQEFVCIALGSSFDLELYNKLVQLIHTKGKSLFL